MCTDLMQGFIEVLIYGELLLMLPSCGESADEDNLGDSLCESQEFNHF